MKLSDWARANGISYKTAWLWWKRGKLPVPGKPDADRHDFGGRG
jgi:putative resolvase